MPPTSLATRYACQAAWTLRKSHPHWPLPPSHSLALSSPSRPLALSPSRPLSLSLSRPHPLLTSPSLTPSPSPRPLTLSSPPHPLRQMDYPFGKRQRFRDWGMWLADDEDEMITSSNYLVLEDDDPTASAKPWVGAADYHVRGRQHVDHLKRCQTRIEGICTQCTCGTCACACSRPVHAHELCMLATCACS